MSYTHLHSLGRAADDEATTANSILTDNSVSASISVPDMRRHPLVHAGAGVWLAGVGAYGLLAPDRYEILMQEDRIVEWATVWLFLIAGGIGLLRGIRQRRVFDGLVALFCLFVAGEEFSWGQRLIGYYPPEFFLEHNFQQETNLHNLPQSFLQPKWVLMMALAGYGILLPLAARQSNARGFLSRAGATTPSLELLPWFVAAVVLLLWYPLPFTGEWIEAFAGGLFLLSSGISATASGVIIAATIGLAAITTTVSGQLQRGRDQQRAVCAEQEVSGLINDIVSGSAGTDDLWQMRRIHKRVWSSIVEEYLHPNHLQTFKSVTCTATTGESVNRHTYGIDPWGSPYWLEVERTSDDDRRVTVYSFGPNRRRDRSEEETGNTREESDDIRVSAVRSVSPQ